MKQDKRKSTIKAAADYLRLDNQIKKLTAERDAAKALCLATLDEYNTDELNAGGYEITRGVTIARVFNSKRFKNDHPKQYENYRDEQPRNHFHVVKK